MAGLNRSGKTIGFVPTMGGLHEGHLSLVRAARRENDAVAVSIFVNPAQFGPREDFARYPRPLGRDLEMLRKEKVDYLFRPSVRSMYPGGYVTAVEVGAAGYDRAIVRRLCGKSRPGHFRGVATVCLKLFHLAGPDRVYFGAKDYQQALIIRRLIRDLNLDIEFRLMPIVREKDGLAMSSRNRYLSPEDRRRAAGLSRILFGIRRGIRAGKTAPGHLRAAALRRLKKIADRVDYLEIVDPHTLAPLTSPQPRMLAAAACFIGKTRLIDNVILSSPYSRQKNRSKKE